MSAVKVSSIRYETKAQFERHRKAAQKVKWSMNRFYLEAADMLAEKLMSPDDVLGKLIAAMEQPIEQGGAQ